jgi:hypothetical protein
MPEDPDDIQRRRLAHAPRRAGKPPAGAWRLLLVNQPAAAEVRGGTAVQTDEGHLITPEPGHARIAVRLEGTEGR